MSKNSDIKDKIGSDNIDKIKNLCLLRLYLQVLTSYCLYDRNFNCLFFHKHLDLEVLNNSPNL